MAVISPAPLAHTPLTANEATSTSPRLPSIRMHTLAVRASGGGVQRQLSDCR